MRAGTASAVTLVTLAACTFTPPSVLVNDAKVVDATGDDAPGDSPIDAIVSPRVQAGLIGFWTFDQANGSPNALDTSGSAVLVPLKVETSPTIFPPTFAAGNLSAPTLGARLISAPSTHLASDTATAVTLEAWVLPSVAKQGDLGSPKFLAGIAKSVTLRDIVLLQADDKWVGRVRTTASQDGTPSLISTSKTSLTEMTHLVLVADATQRILYVNDVPEAIGDPGAPMGWDTTYVMALFDEPPHARQWLGAMAMVALYNRALSVDEVHQNFMSGPDAP